MEKQMKCLALVVLLGALLPGPSADAADSRIALIDLDRVFNALERTEQGQAKVEEAKESFRAEMEGLNEQIDTLLGEQEGIAEDALNSALSEDVRRQRREEGELKAVEISELRSKKNKLFKERETQLRQKIMRMRQDIIDDIVAVAQEYARDEGFSMLLDKSGMSVNQVPVVLYSDPKNDITDVIIEQLNGASE
jgi:Skp family chaperone for outer membrane proteins